MDIQDTFLNASGKSSLRSRKDLSRPTVMSPGLPVRLGQRVRSAEFKTSAGRQHLPWHRVVNRHGAISLTGPDLQRQRQALLAEGVVVSGSGQIDLQRYRWCINPLRNGEGWRRINTG